jgi:hypothetical protein
VQSLWKSEWRLLRKLEIELPYAAAEPLLGIQPKESKSAYNRHLHTHVDRSPVHNNHAMESAQVPSTDDRIKIMWYICTVGFIESQRKMNLYCLQENGWS